MSARDRTGQAWEHVDAVFLVVGEPTRSHTLASAGTHTTQEPILYHPIALLDGDCHELTRAAERPDAPWEDCDVMTRIA